MIPSQCVFCRHFHHERNDPSTAPPSCDAFATIPEEIFMGRFDHSEAFPDDDGVRFSLIETERQDFLELNTVRGELGLLTYGVTPVSNSVCHQLLPSTPRRASGVK
jgi:hypothetical protein